MKMSAVEQSITESFRESIVKNITDTGVDTSEVVLDTFMEEGIIREIPIVKYAASAYKVVQDVRGMFYLRKLKQFIDSFNEGMTSEEDVQQQREKFSGKNRNRELTYISIIIDQYLDFDKPAILAKLYLAYLNEDITWAEFCTYAEIINKLTKIDLEYFFENKSGKTEHEDIPAELLRLVSVGLMSSFQNNSPFEPYGEGRLAVFQWGIERVMSRERLFQRTSFGQKFADILSNKTGD